MAEKEQAVLAEVSTLTLLDQIDTIINQAPREVITSIREKLEPYKNCSRLLSLPREMRDRIYKHLVDGTPPRSRQKLPGLLHTCRQLRAEFAPIFFAGTPIELRPKFGAGPDRLSLKKLRRRDRRLVQKLLLTTLGGLDKESVMKAAGKWDSKLGVERGICVLGFHPTNSRDCRDRKGTDATGRECSLWGLLNRDGIAKRYVQPTRKL